MDEFDRAILDVVQNNNLLSQEAIGERVNLSASSVRRRLDRMRKDGTIIADVALIDPAAHCFTVIVQISFRQDSRGGHDLFQARMRADPAVSQCYSVSGPVDYVVIVHAATPDAYEQWARSSLMDDETIYRFDSHVVWSRPKFTTAIIAAGEE